MHAILGKVRGPPELGTTHEVEGIDDRDLREQLLWWQLPRSLGGLLNGLVNLPLSGMGHSGNCFLQLPIDDALLYVVGLRLVDGGRCHKENKWPGGHALQELVAEVRVVLLEGRPVPVVLLGIVVAEGRYDKVGTPQPRRLQSPLVPVRVVRKLLRRCFE
eukprot:UN0179